MLNRLESHGLQRLNLHKKKNKNIALASERGSEKNKKINF